MVDKVVLTFLLLDFVFVLSGGTILAAALIIQNGGNTMATDTATNFLLRQTPLSGAIINAVLIFATFIVSIPSLFIPKNRAFLRVHSWLVIVCAFVTMIIGLMIWFSTLQTRSNLGTLWALQTPQIQDSLQQQFTCCGYWNSTAPVFQVDEVCPTAAAAALLPGCVGPFSNFANGLLDVVFTAVFGICALDGLLFLSAVVVLKDRAQKERYRLIDEKSGFDGI